MATSKRGPQRIDKIERIKKTLFFLLFTAVRSCVLVMIFPFFRTCVHDFPTIVGNDDDVPVIAACKRFSLLDGGHECR